MSNHAKHAFGKDQAATYDQRNQHLEPINANIYYLLPILLSDLPLDAKVLFVGSGTGTEVVALANAFPQFSFTAVEPSEAMLEVSRERLSSLSLLKRTQLVHGYVQDLPQHERFDAAICLLVLHHTSDQERNELIRAVHDRLKPAGYFIASELSYDFSKTQPNDLMEKWKVLLGKSSASKERLDALPAMMKEHLSIQTPSEFEYTLTDAGFAPPIQFFQSLIIRAWYTQKPT